VVALSSASAAVSVPASVTVPAGATSAAFAIATTPVAATVVTTLAASYGGVTRTTTFIVTPPPAPVLAAFALDRAYVLAGASFAATVTLSAPAPAGGAQVKLKSSNTGLVAVPASVLVPAGASATTFPLTAGNPKRSRMATLSATYGGITRTAAITVAPN
jgi:hypothetical protein